MIQSMTGFGKAVKEISAGTVTTEIKTLNSKNQNITIHLPEAYRDKEHDLRNKISTPLERGKIDVYIKTENLKQQQKVTLNRPVIENYYELLSDIANAKGHSPHDEQIFQVIMRLPEVLTRWNELGVTVVGGSTEAAVRKNQFDAERWTKVIKAAGIRAE